MSIQKINVSIENKKNKRLAISLSAKALKEFQNELGSQDVLDARKVLAALDKKLMNQIIYLKKKANKFYEQSSSQT